MAAQLVAAIRSARGTRLEKRRAPWPLSPKFSRRVAFEQRAINGGDDRTGDTHRRQKIGEYPLARRVELRDALTKKRGLK